MKTVRDFDFSGKRVLMRLDVNVPLKDGKVVDSFRIRHALPTVKHVLSKCRQLILMSHAGRPNGKIVPELSLKPVAERMAELLGEKIVFFPDYLNQPLPDAKIILLENLRFQEGEKKNDPELAKRLASFGDIFVNEAFAVSHRPHASVYGVAKLIPGCIGLGVEKELKYLNLNSAQRPIMAIIGGAKLETKIPVIKNLLHKVDKILLGGAMIFNFYKAKGWSIGKSLYQEEFLKDAEEFLDHEKIVLPTDLVAANEISENSETQVVPAENIPDDMIGLDIGPESVKKFKEILGEAKTIIWNGPLGYYEIEKFAKATNEMIDCVCCLGVTNIIGGGDTSAAVHKRGIADKFAHISTGGGASLTVLAGEPLVALEALRDD